MTVALDSNVLLYAEALILAPGDAMKVWRIAAMLPLLRAEGLVIPAQVLGEVFIVLVRRGRRTRQVARDVAEEWAVGAVEVPGTDQAILLAAAQLASEHGFQIWDAVILAAAAEAGCALLLSEDMQDGFAWRGVTVANPFAATPHPLLRRYIPPM